MGRDKGAKELQCRLKVFALANFIGPPDESPFQAIVDYCDAEVFNSTILALAVQFKWETNVSRLVSLHLGWHICVLALASATMVATTQAQLRDFDEGSSSLRVAAAQIALTVVVVLDLLKILMMLISLVYKTTIF